MKIQLRTISLVAIPLCSSAQVTVSEADIAPRIGDRLEYVLQLKAPSPSRWAASA
jgi:hypothetical protein